MITDRQANLLDHDAASKAGISEAIDILNDALTAGDAARILDALGVVARDRGMTHVSRETGLARESLYRSLRAGGNPEFMTVMKVLTSLGVRLEAKAPAPSPSRSAAPGDGVWGSSASPP